MSEWVRLELDTSTFDASRFSIAIDSVGRGGLRLTTLDHLGNTPANQRRMYELNATCSADIPDRGAFYSWEEYLARRVAVEAFDPRGVVLALDGRDWIGMAATSDHHEGGYVFNEMTGVLRTHRRRGVALAMKVFGMSFAGMVGARWVRTIHHPENMAMIRLNLALGYRNAEGQRWA
jgi:hypothetical protein